MTPLPVLTYHRMDKALVSLGFKKIRQKGSHVFYRNSDGRTTTVPNHAGDLAKPLVREILHEINITPEQLQHWIDQFCPKC